MSDTASLWSRSDTSSRLFREGLALARHIVEHLPMLHFRNYTALHIRAGGSTIDIGGVQTEAVPWSDAHVSPLAQTWIDTFRKQDFTKCKDELAVISDSTRVVSEIRYSAQDRIMVTNCCRQPLHRDRYVDQHYKKSLIFSSWQDLAC